MLRAHFAAAQPYAAITPGQQPEGQNDLILTRRETREKGMINQTHPFLKTVGFLVSGTTTISFRRFFPFLRILKEVQEVVGGEVPANLISSVRPGLGNQLHLLSYFIHEQGRPLAS
jgi:hypothetical protein